jgi:hypothetical protein
MRDQSHLPPEEPRLTFEDYALIASIVVMMLIVLIGGGVAIGLFIGQH